MNSRLSTIILKCSTPGTFSQTMRNHPYDLGPPQSVKLIESGPLRAIVEVKHATGKSSFVQHIILYAGIDRVDVANTIDWHEQHVI